MKKKIIIIICSVILVLGVAGYGIGSYFTEYALSPESDSDQRNIDEKDQLTLLDNDQKIIEDNAFVEDQYGYEFQEQTQETSIKSQDQLSLKARFKKQDTHNWVILIHGYKSNNENMMDYGYRYYQKGYNVLLPNNRAHGNSEGRYIGMGWLDKDDIMLWIDWIIQQDENAKIVIHGVSMGGATTMMLSGENPDHVVGYIEDCGYSSVWNIFKSELSKRFSLPTFPILDISNLVVKFKAGYDLKEASSVEQIKKSDKPMLFIHGKKDDFVPVEMVYDVYNAKTKGVKDIFIVEQAGHAQAKDYDPDAYWNKVFDFINKNIK